MDEEEIRHLTALPEKQDGFLGPVWVYDGKKYEDEREALGVRRDRLHKAGLVDPFAERAVPEDADSAKGGAATTPPTDEDEPARPAIVTVLYVVAALQAAAGVLAFLLLAGTRPGLGFVVLFWGFAGAALTFGFAKLIELVGRIERHLRP